MCLTQGVTAVMGPSGAGKSTFLSAIGGFIPVTSGAITWKGADITSLAPAKRPSAVLFQDNNLFPHLTLYRNLALALTGKSRLNPDQDALVLNALNRVGLEGLGNRRPADVSGGQQSRAALARVLLQDKPVLLLDEPFAALGPALKSEMLDLLNELTQDKGTTVLMVTHDPKDAERIAQSVVVVDQGCAQVPIPTATALASDGPLAGYLSPSSG